VVGLLYALDINRADAHLHTADPANEPPPKTVRLRP
jgi:hypothetical protein